MTEEPVYHYKKGCGWVSGPEFPTHSTNAGIYKLTLEQRKPEPGERWRLDRSSLGIEAYTDYIVKEEGWNFNSPRLVNELGVSYNKFSLYDDNTTIFYTLKMERL